MTLRRRTFILLLWVVVLVLAIAQLVLAVSWIMRNEGSGEAIDVVRLVLAVAATVLAVLMVRTAARDRARTLAEANAERSDSPEG